MQIKTTVHRTNVLDLGLYSQSGSGSRMKNTTAQPACGKNEVRSAQIKLEKSKM
jgi:hypothetical protein